MPDSRINEKEGRAAFRDAGRKRAQQQWRCILIKHCFKAMAGYSARSSEGLSWHVLPTSCATTFSKPSAELSSLALFLPTSSPPASPAFCDFPALSPSPSDAQSALRPCKQDEPDATTTWPESPGIAPAPAPDVHNASPEHAPAAEVADEAAVQGSAATAEVAAE